jgi:hypothetical protein
MPAALAGAAVLAVTRLGRDRCEPVKVLAARRRPVRATGGHTVSQSWPPGSGNKQPEESRSPEPITLGQRLDIPDAQSGK